MIELSELYPFPRATARQTGIVLNFIDSNTNFSSVCNEYGC